MRKDFWFLLLFCMILCISVEGKNYHFKDDPIDVVIVSHPKDKKSLKYCIKGIKKNGENIRRVIVVSPKPLSKDAEWFDESKFPFSKKDVASQIGREDAFLTQKFFAHGHPPGWYYQQLLKLYAPFVIPGISSNVLVIDADSVFLRPVKFLTKSHAGLLCKARLKWATYPRYIRFASRLLPNYTRKFKNLNSVHHHMLFQKPILKDLFADVEKHHKMPFWKAFCRAVDLKEGGASEYEVYFSYALAHTKQVKLRHLKRRSSGDLSSLKKYHKDGFDLVSFHSYMKKEG